MNRENQGGSTDGRHCSLLAAATQGHSSESDGLPFSILDDTGAGHIAGKWQGGKPSITRERIGHERRDNPHQRQTRNDASR